MPLMSLTSTLLDQTAESRDHVIQNVFKYLGTDTCCFLADAELRALVKRQKKAFTPVREWLENEWNCPLAMTDSVFMLKHPQETVARVKTMLQSLDSAALTALQVPPPPP
jgi:chaperone required for assembly of F1-ATPase